MPKCRRNPCHQASQRHSYGGSENQIYLRRLQLQAKPGAGGGNQGPVEPSAIGPISRTESSGIERSESDTIAAPSSTGSPTEERKPKGNKGQAEPEEEIYQEGDDRIIEDKEGNVLEVMKSQDGETEEQADERAKDDARKFVKEGDVKDGVAQRTDSEAEKVAADEPVEAQLEKLFSSRTGRMSVSGMKQKLNSLGVRRRQSEAPPRRMSKARVRKGQVPRQHVHSDMGEP